MFPHLEKKTQPLASRKVFLGRMARSISLAGIVLAICLAIGTLGYHYLGEMQWILKPTEGGTEVTYQCLFSPGGQIPSSVLNVVIKQIGVETIINLRKVARQPHYQSTTIVTQTLWQEGN